MGQIINTNAQICPGTVFCRGFIIAVVGDNAPRLSDDTCALKRADLVILTGVWGPPMTISPARPLRRF